MHSPKNHPHHGTDGDFKGFLARLTTCSDETFEVGTRGVTAIQRLEAPKAGAPCRYGIYIASGTTTARIEVMAAA
jgi:hypothetical protein